MAKFRVFDNWFVGNDLNDVPLSLTVTFSRPAMLTMPIVAKVLAKIHKSIILLPIYGRLFSSSIGSKASSGPLDSSCACSNNSIGRLSSSRDLDRKIFESTGWADSWFNMINHNLSYQSRVHRPFVLPTQGMMVSETSRLVCVRVAFRGA